MKTKLCRHLVTAVLVCCSLVSCGARRADVAEGGSPAPRPSVADKACDVEDVPDTTSDDQELPDTTSDDQELPDTTSDDQELPDTTSDDQELPDTTSDDQGSPVGDTTEDGAGAPQVGPHRWFPMTRDFRAYLSASTRKADAAIAAHVERVCVRTPEGGGRTLSEVRVDYGVWEQDAMDRTARVFAHWRESVYGDHGHVDVMAPAKMDAEQDW